MVEAAGVEPDDPDIIYYNIGVLFFKGATYGVPQINLNVKRRLKCQ